MNEKNHFFRIQAKSFESLFNAQTIEHVKEKDHKL